MIGLGTIINTVAIIIGGILGMLLKSALSERIQDTVLKATGVCVLFLGLGGAIAEMLTFADGVFSTQGSLMLIVSCVLGAFVGEIINIEGAIERFGAWLRKITKSEGDGGFLDAFLTSSFTVCIGAMAVVGSIQDGIMGDYTMLTAKAILDFIIIMVMASSMGKGCVFSAVPVFLFQGSITLLARFIEPIMTPQATSNLSFVGSVLIFCVGLNLVWGKKIKVANLLPAIVFAVACAFIM